MTALFWWAKGRRPLGPANLKGPPGSQALGQECLAICQQKRVYPYPLGAGSARPNPKMGAPDPENPWFLGFSVLRGGFRPWSQTMVSEGARPWGRGRPGDCEYYSELLDYISSFYFQGIISCNYSILGYINKFWPSFFFFALCHPKTSPLLANDFRNHYIRKFWGSYFFVKISCALHQKSRGINFVILAFRIVWFRLGKVCGDAVCLHCPCASTRIDALLLHLQLAAPCVHSNGVLQGLSCNQLVADRYKLRASEDFQSPHNPNPLKGGEVHLHPSIKGGGVQKHNKTSGFG